MRAAVKLGFLKLLVVERQTFPVAVCFIAEVISFVFFSCVVLSVNRFYLLLIYGEINKLCRIFVGNI